LEAGFELLAAMKGGEISCGLENKFPPKNKKKTNEEEGA
jgi:hypothetical protein